jgi:hypothetical protein
MQAYNHVANLRNKTNEARFFFRIHSYRNKLANFHFNNNKKKYNKTKMNNSQNVSEYYYYTVESLLTNFVGSSYLTDVLSFYPFTIVSILGLFLNVFAVLNIFGISARRSSPLAAPAPS